MRPRTRGGGTMILKTGVTSVRLTMIPLETLYPNRFPDLYLVQSVQADRQHPDHATYGVLDRSEERVRFLALPCDRDMMASVSGTYQRSEIGQTCIFPSKGAMLAALVPALESGERSVLMEMVRMAEGKGSAAEKGANAAEP